MNSKHILAVDIGSSTVKAMIARKDSKLTVLGIGEAPNSGMDKGQLIDVKDIAHAVKQAVDCACLAAEVVIHEAYIGIGGLGLSSDICTGCVSSHSTNCITEEDLNRANQAAILSSISPEREVLHNLPLSFCVDGKNFAISPVGSSGTRVEITYHVISMPKEIYNSLISSLNDEGIVVKSIVANMVVAAIPIIEQSEQNCLILDVGSELTSTGLICDGKLVQLDWFPLGGRYVTRDIMFGLGVTEEEATLIKNAYSKIDQKDVGTNFILNCSDFGCTNQRVEYDFLQNIIESRAEEISGLLAEGIRQEVGLTNVSSIYLLGGCSYLCSFSTWIHKYFDMPVLFPEYEISSEYQDRRYGVCIGLIDFVSQNMTRLIEDDVSKKITFMGKVLSLFR